MNPRVKSVKPQTDFKLFICFENGKEKIFDVKPYLDFGLFRELKELKIFDSVQPFMGSIRWSNDLDICPDTLYLDFSSKNGSIAAESGPVYGK